MWNYMRFVTVLALIVALNMTNNETGSLMHAWIKLALAICLVSGGLCMKTQNATAVCIAPTLGAELDANRTIVSIYQIPPSLVRKTGAKEGDKILSFLDMELTEENVNQIDEAIDEWVRYAREDDGSLLVQRNGRVASTDGKRLARGMQ